MKRDKRILIIGAGPTGLGAATRLAELGCENWEIIEASDCIGGLARSVTDDAGFTWDIGVHINFSHYEHVDEMMLGLPNFEWLQGKRESWVWTKDRWVPFAFQNNIHRLPDDARDECLSGLIAGRETWPKDKRPENFEEWIQWMFGEGIAKHFMTPYNEKIWGVPTAQMNCQWVGERVTPVDLERVKDNVANNQDDLGWGPNAQYRFPKTGGTGSVWSTVASQLPQDKITLGVKLERIDTAKRIAHFSDGSARKFDHLLSAVPLDLLTAMTDLEALKPAAKKLKHSSLHMVGVGLKRPMAKTLTDDMSWIYMPDDNCPFYRVTIMSNLSPFTVPDPENQWSIMTETCESAHRPVNRATIVDEVIEGLIANRMIESREQVIDTHHIRVEHSYPTPCTERDEALAVLLPGLMEHGIFSRGRFGAWKYEIANQDHSVMQGIEAIDKMILNRDEVTVWEPSVVNAPKRWRQGIV